MSSVWPEIDKMVGATGKVFSDTITKN